MHIHRSSARSSLHTSLVIPTIVNPLVYTTSPCRVPSHPFAPPHEMFCSPQFLQPSCPNKAAFNRDDCEELGTGEYTSDRAGVVVRVGFIFCGRGRHLMSSATRHTFRVPLFVCQEERQPPLVAFCRVWHTHSQSNNPFVMLRLNILLAKRKQEKQKR